MLREYIEAAMRTAEYKILEDDGSYFGHVPLLAGVYANESSLESCRNELESVLEDWILFSISQNLDIPELEGISLKVRKVA
jgi:predicted RNase H-like HicB family nuclease